MQVPETDIVWPYSLLKVSENKSTSRTGIPIGSAYELIGVDGSSDGGLKPFPGFREMHRFRMANAPVFPIAGLNPYAGLRHRTKVIDFWSFSVIAGANKRVWGFVYVAKRPNDMTPGFEVCDSTYDLMMDYYAPQGTVLSWSSIVLQENMSDAGVLGTDDSKNNSVMSVETTGRMLYIFRRGVAPVSVFFKYATSPSISTTPIINESAGPGKKSTVGMYQQGSPAVDTDFPATTSATEGHISASFPDPTSAANAPGSVVFCRLDPAVTAAGTAISNIGTGNQFDAGTYSLAVQFEDSRSGRKSQFSQSVEFTFTGTTTKKLFVDGIYDSSKFDVVNIYRSVRTQNAAGAYTGGIMQLEARVTLSSYDVATLPMRTAATLPSGGDIKYFRYAYQLKDSALVMQDVFLDRAAFYETMPKGGAGALLDGTMLVGNISEEPGDLTGTGETRWSSSTETSVEMFTAKGQYQPPSVGDAVTCFRRCGQMMVGLTRSGVQYYDKSSGFVKVVPAHQGFGTVGPYAACSVGPVVYYLNYRGLKAAFPDGKLDDVQSIDDLVMDEWYSGTTGAQELTKVSIAFDSATLCMYVLNPTRRTAVQMWFSTGVVSELRDQMFSKVTQGWWEDDDGQLVPRALFLMNAPYPDVVTNTSFGPAVFMPCRTEGDKEYPETGVSEPIYMFDSDSLHALGASSIKVTTPGSMPTYFSDSCIFGSLNVQEVTNVAGTQNPATTSTTNASRMIGTWIYTNRSDSKGATDSKHLIVDATATRILVASTTLTDSYSISIDPVYFKWVGHPLRMSEDANEEFVVKQPSSIGCVFTDVQSTTGKAPEGLLWNALLYRNNDTDPYMYSKPTDREGSIVKTSLSTGDSAVWASFDKHGILGQWITPGIEIYLSNVRYRLIGAQVKGRMLPTDRTRRTY